MKFLCKINLHFWKKTSKTERHCIKCFKKQIYINEGPVSGMADFEYWDDVK